MLMSFATVAFRVRLLLSLTVVLDGVAIVITGAGGTLRVSVVLIVVV